MLKLCIPSTEQQTGIIFQIQLRVRNVRSSDAIRAPPKILARGEPLRAPINCRQDQGKLREQNSILQPSREDLRDFRFRKGRRRQLGYDVK